MTHPIFLFIFFAFWGCFFEMALYNGNEHRDTFPGDKAEKQNAVARTIVCRMWRTPFLAAF